MGGDHATLGVTEDADTVGVDSRLMAQPCHGCIGVTGEFGGGGSIVIAAGTAHAALVVAKYGHPGTIECIGQHQKHLMSPNGLIARVVTGAGNQNDCWERTFAQRHAQCAGQKDAGIRIREKHVP